MLTALPATLVLALDLVTPHLSATLTGRAPIIDGNLNDEAWRAAAPTEAFTQQFPFDRQPPSEKTSLRVLYDKEALYFGFDCEQVHTPIVERLTRRDRDSESEWVQVLLDSRNDGKNAFVFAVNISGVLADGQLLNQSTWSFEWDENWDARTARTNHGWSAEIRIPLRVLRFDSSLPVQSWGMQAQRFVAERQEIDLWAYFPREVASPVTYFGRLDDLRSLKGGGAVELRPFALGFGRRRESATDVLASGYDEGGSVGLDLKWHVAPDLTLDASLLPDFAQVEADQVILNLSNYETRLPEKRPLFLEGAEAFSFPIQIFYSRRIGIAPQPPSFPTEVMFTRKLVDVPAAAPIYGAAKLVGRLTPAWTVGAMSAFTARNEVTIQAQATSGMPAPPQRSSELVAPLTAFNVVRLKRELGSAAHVGVIGTGFTTFEEDGGYPVSASGNWLCPIGVEVSVGRRCFHDAYVGGLDASWRSPTGNYVASGAFIESWIHEGPTRPLPDGTQIGAGARAPGGWLRVAKEGGKPIIAAVEYTGLGRALDYSDVGFMLRQNLHEGKAMLGYRTLDAGRLTLDTQTLFEVTQRRNLAGTDLGQLYELNTRLHFRNFWTVSAAANFSPARFDDREINSTGVALERARAAGWRLEIATDTRGRASATLGHQMQIIAGGAYALTAQGSVTVHPLPQLDIELLPEATFSAGEWRYAFNVDDEAQTDGVVPFGKLTARSVSATLRLSYAFRPQLSLQAYAQAFLASGHYTDVRTIPDPGSGAQIRRADIINSGTPMPLNPDFEEAALNVNVVLRWEYRLGSTLFLVYSRSQVPAVSNLNGAGTLDFRQLGNRASADVILFKLSYWWAS